MKRISLLFSALLFTLMIGAQTITLQVKDMAIKDVLPMVEAKSGYHFFYNSSTLVGLDKVVSLDLKDQDIKIVVNKLFEGSAIEYTFMDNKVIALSPAKVGSSKEIAKVNGMVVDEFGEPIIGASVMVKHSSVGTITDFDGNFSLENVKEGAYLAVSYIGYETYEQRVSSKTNTYRITLKESTAALDEVVVVGYGSQKKVNLTGAVSVVKSDDIVGRPTANMATALQGADPALNISMSSGGPSADYNIDIRGVASVVSSVSPLILVDGVEMSLNRVNSNDIESISILKDASASAIYGSKAAGGVVLVTTKSGKEGRAPQVTFDLKAGWKSPTTNTDFITQGFWSAYINDYFMYNHQRYRTTTYTDADYAELWMRLDDVTENPERPWTIVQSDGRYKYYANNDWYGTYFKRVRPMQDYNVSLKGGNDKVNYFISGRYYTEDGMFQQNTDKWDQFSMRAKVNVNIKKWLRYGTNISYFSSKYHYPGTENVRETYRTGSIHAFAFIPSTNPDGSSVYMNPWVYNGAGEVGSGDNAVLNYGKHNNSNTNREMVMKHTLDIDLYKNLTLSADYSFTWRTKEEEHRSVKVPYSMTEGITNYIENFRSVDSYKQTIGRYQTHNYNVYLKWNPTWNQHHLTLMGGYNGEMYAYRGITVERYDLMTEELSNFNFAKGDVSELSESVKKAATNGLFARINYDYDGRYLFEFSFRADASSRFSKENRWCLAPSGSFAWRMSEESFWEPISNWWSNSKLRFSAGQLGNQLTGYYDAYLQVYTDKMFDQSITLDGKSALNYAETSSPNSGSLTWEKMTTYDVGLDMGFFRNRLNFTGDFYIRNTTDMLINGLDLPAVYGATAPKQNLGAMRTTGWELSLSWNDVKKLGGYDFKYSVSAGVGDYTQRITSFPNPVNNITSGSTPYYEGMNVGEIWGFKVDGLFQTDEEAKAYQDAVDCSLVCQDIMLASCTYQGLHAGDLKYVDLYPDGKITRGSGTVQDPGDLTVIGNSLPRFNYNFRVGLEYFGFDASIFFQGVGKRDWYPATEATTFWTAYTRPYQGYIPKDYMSMVWSETNKDAYFPLARGYQANAEFNELGSANSRYLQNIGYIRFKNLTVGYTLPCWKKVFSEFRIFFTGENLWYWSPLKKYCRTIDPESAAAAEQGITYGFSGSYTFGITATF